jgi:C4-dicarboxylate transporter DctQ subunit
MAWVIRLYDRMILMLAITAGIMIAAVFVLIVVDVSMRTAGLRPPIFSSAVSEYSLIYVTMLAAPWLVRERGHVRIDSFLSLVPLAGQRFIERILILVCIALCLTAAYLSAEFAIEFWIKGDIDIRSIEIPRALLLVPLALGFFLCAVEFLRLLLIGETLAAPSDGHGVDFEGEI